MSRPNTANTGSSPPSSADRDLTLYGTPATNLTGFSPAARLGTSHVARDNEHAGSMAMRRSQSGRSVAPGTIFAPGRYPSVTGRPALSPLAEDFQPSQSTGTPRPQVQPLFAQAVAAARGVRPQTARLTARYNAGTPSNVQASPTPRASVPSTGSMSRGILPSGGPNIERPLLLSSIIQLGVFSNEQIAYRAFGIYGIHFVHAHVLAKVFGSYGSLIVVDNSQSANGIVRVYFDGVADAKQAFATVVSFKHNATVPFVGPTTDVCFMTPKQVAAVRGKNPDLVSDFGMQMVLNIGPLPPNEVMPSLEQIQSMLAEFGAVVAMHTLPARSPGVLALRIEFDDNRAAVEAYDSISTKLTFRIPIHVVPFTPDLAHVNHGNNVFSINSAPQPSPTGRSTLSSAQNADALAIARRAQSMPQARAPRGSSQNTVNLDAIRHGFDVRTTIMLRNIPNRIDQANLKMYIDETSQGHYDFMYLRIDFANQCNVGYAFINFVDALSIIDFAERRAGHHWGIFDSNKVAEISYATIQGRDCLISKFRNSSVMLEDPTYRPKLYATYPDANAGEEEAFPPPDNWSKMRRSMENAEHVGLYTRRPARRTVARPANVRTHSRHEDESTSTTSAPILAGLYAPREGQQHREEQRRRRSQFDRGNPASTQQDLAHVMANAVLTDDRGPGAATFPVGHRHY